MPLPGSSGNSNQSTPSANRPKVKLGFDRETPKPGSHQGVLAEIFFKHIPAKGGEGTPDEYTPERYEIFYCWQLRETYKQEDSPMKGKRFAVYDRHFDTVTPGNRHGKLFQTWAASAKPLGKEDLEKWIEMELANPSPLIGENAMLTIAIAAGEKGQQFVNVNSVAPLMEGVPLIQVDENYLPYAEVLKKAEEKRNNPNRGGGRSNPPASKDAPPF